MMSVFW